MRIRARRVAMVAVAYFALAIIVRTMPNLAAAGRSVSREAVLHEDSLLRSHSHLSLTGIQLPLLLKSEATDDSIFALRRDARGKHTLFVLFTYADCYRALADVPFWSEIEQRYATKIRVVGVTSGATPAALRHFLKAQDVKIAVADDAQDALFTALYGAGHLTPALVLVDSTGAVIRIDGARYGDATMQRMYLRVLDSILIGDTPRKFKPTSHEATPHEVTRS